MKITEGLAEIKTLRKRIVSMQSLVVERLCRQSNMKDPCAAEGGTKKKLESTMQAIDDLGKRIVRIRLAINEANAKTPLVIGGLTMSLAAWIVYGREVAPVRAEFFDSLSKTIAETRKQAMEHGFGVGNENSPKDLIINIDEDNFATMVDNHIEVCGKLDGAKSLLNATVEINVE